MADNQPKDKMKALRTAVVSSKAAEPVPAPALSFAKAADARLKATDGRLKAADARLKAADARLKATDARLKGYPLASVGLFIGAVPDGRA